MKPRFFVAVRVARGGAVLILTLAAALYARAQAPQCTTGRIVGASPVANASLQICLPSLRSDPAFVAIVETMNRIANENADSRKRVERMAQALGTTSTELSDAQLRMLARSVADRLGANARSNEARLSREIERISIGLEDVQDKVAEARRDRNTAARANSALAGEGGDAVARLDFAAANQIFDRLDRIDQQVTRIGESVVTVGKDVKGMRDESTLANAFQLLLEIAKSKPKGEMGQSIALRTLLADGRQFRGVDYSGLSFSGSVLPDIDFGGANLQMTDFGGARLEGAKLQKADMTAANMAGANLSRADMTISFNPFVRASDAVFDGAGLARSSWIAADLQRASFRNADLRGANFELADLRGADFRGAKLAHAFFGGADLRNARFEQAEIAGTDMVAAVLSTTTMSAAQRAGLCSSALHQDSGKRFIVYDAMPSSKYDSGYVYDDLLEHRRAWVFWARIADKAFPRCPPRQPDTLPPRQRPVDGDSDWSGQYQQHMQHSLLGVAGRRDEFVNIVLERIASATARAPLASEIPDLEAARAEQRKRLEVRLAAISRDAKPSKTPVFNEYGNAQLLLLKRLAPAALDALKVDWRYMTREDSSAWPPLFEGNVNVMASADKNATTTEVFKAWVARRAEAWQDGVVVYEKVLDELLSQSGPGELRPLAARLGVPLERLSFGPRLQIGHELYVQGVLMFDDSFKDQRIFLAANPGVGRGQSFNLEVKAVRLVEMPEQPHPQMKRLLVWTVRPLGGLPGGSR